MMPFVQVHCVWAAAEAYSAPSIVLTSRSHEGLHVFDDFRESYAWLRHNTEVDDKVCFQNYSYHLNCIILISDTEMVMIAVGCIMVGLWLSDNCNGQQDCDCRQ
jgi:hypothetical protein